MLMDDVGVVVLGLTTDVIAKDILVPAGICVLISMLRVVELRIAQEEAMPARVQEEAAILMEDGKTTRTNEVETSRLIFLKYNVYLVTALILVLLILIEN